MIKKLRKKFIMIAAVSLFSVLAVVVAAINIINNYQLTQNENELLEVIGGSGGRMPDFSGRDDKAPPGGKESSYTDRKNMMRDHKFINEETSYQTRYFVVFYNTSGDITRIDTSHIAAVNGDQAKELAAEALSGTAAERIILPDTVISVAPDAFAGCSRLRVLYIPAQALPAHLTLNGQTVVYTIEGPLPSGADYPVEVMYIR